MPQIPLKCQNLLLVIFDVTRHNNNKLPRINVKHYHAIQCNHFNVILLKKKNWWHIQEFKICISSYSHEIHITQ